MKNIHVLPTDKPSRLSKSKSKEELTFSSDIYNLSNRRHIYITSDEEIKDGDYYLYLKDNKVYQFIRRDHTKLLRLDIQKKIILTTDQDLIKDGVRTIDDEFLKWFVKNPSCEFVEVDRDEREVGNHLGGVVLEYGEYKIIIPKEEAMQRLEKYSERFDNDKSPIGNPDTWGKRIVEEPKQEPCDNCNNEVCCCIIKKQETIETAFESFMNKNFSGQLTIGLVLAAMKFGVYWQQDKNKYKCDWCGKKQ